MIGQLRAATIEDMYLLFGWANDPSVRKNSFASEQIPYEEHREWYTKLLVGYQENYRVFEMQVEEYLRRLQLLEK